MRQRHRVVGLVIACAALPLVACDDDDVKNADGGAADAGSKADGGPTDGAVSLVERGEYLATKVVACQDCHSPRLPSGLFDMTKWMSGVECFAKIPLTPAADAGVAADAGAADAAAPAPSFACLHSRNLTNDASGLKQYTDEQLKTLLRNGQRPNGTALHPAMPYYIFHNTSEDDLNAIVAYLRSLPPIVHMLPMSDAPFVVPAPVPPLDPATLPAPQPTYADQASAARGKYLATQVGLCLECHTKHNMGPGQPVLDPTKYFQGGEDYTAFLPQFHQMIISSNITPDPASGIGTWTVDDIVKLLKQGIDKSNMPICPPMPAGPFGAYGGMHDDDARAIAHYLLSIAPVTVNNGAQHPLCRPPAM